MQSLYIFRYIIDVDLNLVLRFPQSSPVGGDTPTQPHPLVSNTLLNRIEE